jgi:Cu-Zn family superoxide dismutase
VSVELRNASGQAVGTATFTTEGSGLRIAVQVRDLPAGQHGLHVHAIGRCDPPDFMSAGGHHNPTSRQHGLQNPSGPHAGDLPNLEVVAAGTGSLNTTNTLMTLASLFDADGSAIVVHAAADDNTTDPTGNSGGRIACGVISRA